MSDPIDAVRGFYETHIKRYGTGLAGGAFGLGWWAWADAVIMSDSPVGFVKVRNFFVGEISNALGNYMLYTTIHTVLPTQAHP